ncbi:MAG: hypothetical protein KF781_09600 [Chitinophagaceae bacterium]|nr:hypothetical protein [Chitinophagaceae bacterium]MCW5905498.1 hypothetical protein [Chitinophagaceae bacterium]
MSVAEYKESIKQLVDTTNNELLLQHWKKQLEWDIEHETTVELNDEELNLVKEGLTDYESGNYISLEEFINQRK